MSFVAKTRIAHALVLALFASASVAQAKFVHHCYGVGATKGRHFELSIDNQKNVVTLIDAGTSDQNGAYSSCSISGKLYRQNSKEISFVRMGTGCDYSGDKLATIRLQRVLFERGGETLTNGRLGGVLMVDTYGTGQDGMDQYQCVMPFVPVAIR